MSAAAAKLARNADALELIRLDGIILSDGTAILPGLTNSFLNYSRLPWHRRYRSFWITGVVLVSIFLSMVIKVDFGPDDAFLDSLAINVDFGDVVKPFTRKNAKPIIEIDEVFGNQFVKKDAEVVNPEDYVEAAAAQAENPIAAGATPPEDLTPSDRPDYPPAAKAAGVEGTVTLELIIDADGKVLRARPAGRKLGSGLEEAAVRKYMTKKFKPSYGPDGKPLKFTKFYLPVRFSLE